MFFPVVMYRCESWTIKKAQHWRIDAFKLWCWKRFLRVPWTARRSVSPKGNQHWTFIGRSTAEALILWPCDVRADSLEKTLMLGKTESNRKRGPQRMRLLDSITESMVMNLSKLQEIVGDMLQSMGSHKESDTTYQLNNNKMYICVHTQGSKVIRGGKTI